MSKINIKRIVESLKTKTTYLVPIVEAVCNSIDAINGEKDGLVTIKVKRVPSSTTLDGSRAIGDIIGIEIHDNGVGFTNENRESFDTYRSDYKYQQGGKGFGRFMYLKYFKHVSISSIYFDKDDNNSLKMRSFQFGTENNIIINEKIEKLDNKQSQTGTILKLDSIIQNSGIDKSIDVIARKLVERILVYFVNPESPAPKIVLEESDGSKSIVLNDYIGDNKDISLVGKEKILLTGRSKDSSSFEIQIYKIYYSSMISKVCLTAHRREVTETPLHHYIPEFKDQLFETNNDFTPQNYIVKAYVVGEFLDDNVSVERDSFALSKDDQDLFSEFSEAEIEQAAASVVRKYFSNVIEERFSNKKAKVEHYVNNKAPWHKELINDLDIQSMPMGISEPEIEMRLQKCKFEKEQNTQATLNELIANQEENTASEIIREQVREIVSGISEAGKNDLVHYVCNRKKILDLFDSLRSRREDGSPHLEEDIHNIIFPMRKTDQEICYEDHNLWLIDERLVFSQFIASDKVVSREETIEPDLAVFFNKRVALRNGENTTVSPISIYEFKRPRRTNYQEKDNPINQACKYARKILEGKYEMPDGKENIKVDPTHTPIYLYIIADIVPKIKDFADQANLTQTPDGEGYIGFMKAYNAYVQIMSFKKLVDDARMRNAIFFRKIGLSL